MSKSSSWNGAKDTVEPAGPAFFPLDEELQLLPGQYTPNLQETMTRLGSKMPFEQAAGEVWYNQRTQVDTATLRRVTHRHGQLAERIERAEAERIAQEAPKPTATPERVLVSSDGAYIHLTTGEWREVKTMIVGEFESVWRPQVGELQVRTSNISYFSRSYPIREFEQYALPELHRRGLANAQQVATVNDGSEWIQSFADYHFPQAIRILDFRHATDYLVAAGQAAWGEHSPQLAPWMNRMAHQLKHKTPSHTLADIDLLRAQVDSDEKIAAIDHARRYLQKREKLIDYAHFRAEGLPIGSGSVESSHKGVVQIRMKQAGMRWAERHVDPMLALRNLVCNGRWSAGWSQISAFHWQQKRQAMRQQAKKQRPHLKRVTFATVKVAPDSPPSPPTTSPQKGQPHRPAEDHPWRRNIWPTKESWRWN